MQYNGEKITVTLTSRFAVDDQTKQVSIICSVLYHYMRGMVRRPLIDCACEATIDIVPFPDTLAAESIPPRLMSILYSVAIGALRGMVAKRVASTELSLFPLPLVNISELISNQLYGSTTPVNTHPFSELVIS